MGPMRRQTRFRIENVMKALTVVHEVTLVVSG